MSLIWWMLLLLVWLFAMLYVIIDVLNSKRKSTSKAWWIAFALIIPVPTAIVYAIVN